LIAQCVQNVRQLLRLPAYDEGMDVHLVGKIRKVQ